MTIATKRVLIVDDNLKLIKFLEIDLKIHGFEVFTASSGQAALDQLRSSPLDIVILDIRMPNVDGFEVLKQLREFSKVPVIAYSATPEFSARALECGANAFVAKPFDLAYVINLAKELTDHR